MLARVKEGLREGERGISGIETAIILLAFVVVASVFSYSILSAGIFSAEKGKEAIYNALDAVNSTINLKGPVIAEDTNGDGIVDQILFTLTNTGNGAVNLTITSDSDNDGLLSDEANPTHHTVISYLDTRQRIEDIAWSKSVLGRDDGDNLLEPGERFQITVNLTGLTTTVLEYRTFTLEVKPEESSALIIERSIPAQVDPIMDLR